MSNRTIVVPEAKGAFQTVERKIPEAEGSAVVVKVEACGICHSDCMTKDGLMPHITYPRAPGHEVVGTVVKVGPLAKRWKVGDRVGRGWLGGVCFECPACRRGDFILCHAHQITGITCDGGYCEYMSSPWEALARVPAELKSEDAAPLMCAGLTVFNSMRRAGVMSGSLVAIQGIGGLGHYAVQFARAMGFRVAAISSGEEKKALASELGAHIYINTSTQNPVEELQRYGGAKLIVCTGYSAKSMADLIGGLGDEGKLLILGAPSDALAVSGVQLLMRRQVVYGFPSGTAQDSEETLEFAALHGIKSYIQKYTFDQVEEAYAHMISGKAKFRVVITPH